MSDLAEYLRIIRSQNIPGYASRTTVFGGICLPFH